MRFVSGVVGAVCALASLGAGVQPAALVRVDAARLESVANWRQVTGAVRPSRRSALATQEQGLVLSVDVEAGDFVSEGHVLVKLDDVRATLELEGARAAVRSREAMIDERDADLADARRDLALMETSAKANSATPTEVDDALSDVTRAEARVAEAKADLASANAAVRLAERRQDDMTIEAPFAGYVVRKQAEVGQWVSEGDTIIEILALDQVHIWLDVPERFLSVLSSSGGKVRIRLDAIDRELETSISGIVPDVDPLSRLAPVRVEVKNEDGAIKPGMSVVGLVPTGEMQELLTVHKDAILRDDAGEFLYFDAGGRAAIARIERHFAVGDRVAIRPGSLPPGANVVIEGNERLFAGQPLNVSAGTSGAVEP